MSKFGHTQFNTKTGKYTFGHTYSHGPGRAASARGEHRGPLEPSEWSRTLHCNVDHHRKGTEPWKYTPDVEQYTPDFGDFAFRGETRGATRRAGDRTRRDGDRTRDSLGRRRRIISVKHLPGERPGARRDGTGTGRDGTESGGGTA